MLGEHALDAERRETLSGVGKGQPVQRVHRVAVVGLALVAGLVALGAPLTTARAQVQGVHRADGLAITPEQILAALQGQ